MMSDRVVTGSSGRRLLELWSQGPRTGMKQSKEHSAVLVNAIDAKAWQRGVIQVWDRERTF